MSLIDYYYYRYKLSIVYPYINSAVKCVLMNFELYQLIKFKAIDNTYIYR